VHFVTGDATAVPLEFGFDFAICMTNTWGTMSDKAGVLREMRRLITGDAGLDLTVPVEHTREYLSLLPGARHVTLYRTGHLGTVTRPVAFAGLVREFCGSRQSEPGVPRKVAS
jgi:pimeloyl-ACP methyl ester carboxylesterase